MSEPLSSVEIEDVLSSIRRLVSEDLRPGVRVSRPSETPQNGGGKLILTPALRVIVDDRPAAGLAPLPNRVPTASAIEQVMAVVGAAVGAQNDDWEPEIGDVEIMSSESGAALEGWLQTKSAATEVWAEEIDVGVVEFQTFPPAKAFMSEDADGYQDDGRGDPIAIEPILTDSDENTDIPGWTKQSGGGQPTGEDDLAPSETRALEPDVAWADEAEARVIAELENEQDASVEPHLFVDAQGAAFEEQVLRELVRDIIRDELQGGLGERITRNIRKLVRAEIARALATQALD